MTDSDVTAAGNDAAGVPERIRFCSACGQDTPFDQAVCPRCGQVDDIAARSGPSPFTGPPCRLCQEPTPAGASWCARCGVYQGPVFWAEEVERMAETAEAPGGADLAAQVLAILAPALLLALFLLAS